MHVGIHSKDARRLGSTKILLYFSIQGFSVPTKLKRQQPLKMVEQKFWDRLLIRISDIQLKSAALPCGAGLLALDLIESELHAEFVTCAVLESAGDVMGVSL